MVGIEDVMRVSSVMVPFLIGTLKSTRMNTRLPRRSRSLIEYFVIMSRRAWRPASTVLRPYNFLSRSTHRFE